MPDKKESYLDEKLGENETESERARLPLPNEEGQGKGTEEGYPGRENRADKNFERPDEFGDGDRRS
jgi:hypothetical protein